jgi:hypothetical protein
MLAPAAAGKALLLDVAADRLDAAGSLVLLTPLFLFQQHGSKHGRGRGQTSGWGLQHGWEILSLPSLSPKPSNASSSLMHVWKDDSCKAQRVSVVDACTPIENSLTTGADAHLISTTSRRQHLQVRVRRGGNLCACMSAQ